MTADELIDRTVLQVLLRTNSGELHAIGSGCIIHSRPKAALMLTAKHLFEEIERIDRPRELYHPITPPEFRGQLPLRRALTRSSMMAVYILDGRPIPCRMEPAIFSNEPNSDLALCLLVHEESHADSRFESFLPLDTTPLQPGVKVVALGFPKIDIHLEAERPNLVDLRVEWARIAREGEVLAVHDSCKESILKGPCYEVSAPFDPGMSGGPILDRAQLTVRGIVSVGSTFQGPDSPGTGSPLWPLAGFRIPTGKGAEELDFVEKIRRGQIHDRGHLHEHYELVQIGDSRVVRRVD